MLKRRPAISLDKLAKEAMLARGFLIEESIEMIQQLSQLRSPAPSDKDIKDLSELHWFSIDNEDSLDLDQLTYAEKLSSGEVKLLVAIADVDALVPKDCPIDLFAQNNSTSVYTPTLVFPMLPTKLSNNLTSLNLGEKRRAMVVEMTLSKEGELSDFSLYAACVKNHAKLAYPEVAKWLENQKGDFDQKTKEQLLIHDEITEKMEAFRHKHGALSFETTELHPLLTEAGEIELEEWVKNRATSIIENCMIAANEATTRFLTARNTPTFRRVVKTPEKWDRIVALASSMNYTLPLACDSHALEEFLRIRKKEDPETFPDLCLSLIKLLGRGEYQVGFPGQTLPGHFALAVRDYAHSTAPNRRYPDLITQRLIKATLQKTAPPYSSNELIQLAAHCSEKEVDAEKVERQMKKSAAAVVLISELGKKFPAIVTGVASKGSWVRILHPPIEGKLVNPSNHLQVGDRVRVKLVFVDPIKGYIDFQLEKYD